MNLSVFIFPALYFLGCILIGVLMEKFLLKNLLKAAHKTKWKGDEIIVDAFKGILIFFGIAIGALLAVNHLPFSDTVKSVSGKVIFSVIVFSISVLVGRILVGLIRSRGSDAPGLLPSTSIIANITRVIVFIIGVLVILQTLGISITPILTALGVGGLAVALALQDTLSNLFAGVQVIASQQIRNGDYIKLDTGEEGYVVDTTWRSTTIQALPNNLIIIPNSKLASAIIRNYQLPDTEIAVLVEVGVSYGSDLEKVERVTIQTAKNILQNIEGGVVDFEPFIRYHTFSDSSINFSTILRAKEFTYQYPIKHEFIKALHEQFRKNEIEIPFPIRTVHLKREI
jgi:small-conductance mechanosensitive channel